jgi:hypothetical protein
MSLNQYAAKKRLQIFDDLRGGKTPSEGAFDEALLREARTKGTPQMGTTEYTPDSIRFEFIFPDPKGAPIVLSIILASPERIVFMPVPEWVVESIWQGEINGTPQFESDALRMLSTFRQNIESDENAEQFAGHRAVGRG